MFHKGENMKYKSNLDNHQNTNLLPNKGENTMSSDIKNTTDLIQIEVQTCTVSSVIKTSLDVDNQIDIIEKDPQINVYTATHQGILNLADVQLQSHVLDNGMRVFNQTELFKAFNRPRKGEVRIEGLPSIVGAKNLGKYVNKEIKEILKPIHYIDTEGNLTGGYNAFVIPCVCDLYLMCEDAGELRPNQVPIAKQAQKLIRALSKLGIIALIDEATGYQKAYKKEYQYVVNLYVNDIFLPWKTRFHRVFFEQVYRLYNWNYNPYRMRHPQCLGHFINKYVYSYLPDGCLKALKTKNPKDENTGLRKRKHHQHLSKNIGLPHLEKHLLKLITIMELSSTIDDFKQNIKKVSL